MSNMKLWQQVKRGKLDPRAALKQLLALPSATNTRTERRIRKFMKG